MRKHRILLSESALSSERAWLDLDRIASVEVTSEEQGYPIASALVGDGGGGWRAANPGTQSVPIVFEKPQKLRRIWLAFEDSKNRRTEEFVLRWSPGTGHSFREIVRREWNFSNPDSIHEIEDYAVELSEVVMLELILLPDKRNDQAFASLRRLRLA